ncbi:VWA domain-containing protein [Methanoculleus sp. UBA303]|uniref:VWA domain-containing protein n=1 Tax=Methanoculleus sp. UBA303 TaxID=1915497 RepID=UPI0025D097D7|nr:VWA domain-containing protein [Methanoculleus sp. UBA303]
MKVWTYAFMAMGLLFFAVPAGALIPDDIVVGTVPVWVTAGGGDTATVTAWVNSSTSDETSSTSGSTSFESVGVDFVVNNTLGSISPAHAETGSDDGRATAVFRYGIRSGDVNVTARMALDASVINYTDLHIDHATPYQINNTWYSPKVTAGGEAKIIVRMVDRYGNVVDSKREDALNVPSETENLTFVVGSPGGGAVFANGRDEITVPVDENGNATATLRVDTVTGENIVYIQPPAPIRGEYITIRGAADGVPAGITRSVFPEDATASANGEDTVTLMYVLTDAYGNPAGGQGLWVNSSGLQGQSKLINSSSGGEVWVTYGPEASAGVVTITATAAANASVSDSTEVEFASTEPVDMVISASPRSMPSRDANANSVSELRAKVIDIRGNPVAGETVTFEIVSNRSAPYNQTVDQVLETGFAITNSDGSAIVKFRPGAFTDRKAPGWDAAATGNATVRATWGNVTRGISVTRDVVLTWKNYPYLSVETEVSNRTVAKGEGVNVTIRLKGDGSMLQSNPVDVVLAIDRSWSMNQKDEGTNTTRMAAAKNAAKTFVAEMNPEQDRIGLVSYSGYTTRNLPLTGNFLDVSSTVDDLIEDLESGIFTATRKALRDSIWEMNRTAGDANPNAVRAVILMSDGEYNCYGDPLARGTGFYLSAIPPWAEVLPEDSMLWKRAQMDYKYFWDLRESLLGIGEVWVNGACLHTSQNMSVYAKKNNVRLYMISFTDEIEEGNTTWETMDILAEATGGKHYHADTGGDLARIYTEIAGELKAEAGVNTTMNLNFENVEVNTNPVPGDLVFDYVYKDGVSTHIHNQTGAGTVLYNGTIDQTDGDGWKQDKQLHFDIGTVRLGQTWEATFRLKVNKTGNINIFNESLSNSVIAFDGGGEGLILPDTYITGVDIDNTGIISPIVVEFTPEPGPGPFVDVVPLTWVINYNGAQEVDVSLAYSRYEDGQSPSTFFVKTLPAGTFAGEDTMITDSTMMDVRDLAPGQYWITVAASARGAEDDNTTSLWAHIKDPSRSHIKIG